LRTKLQDMMSLGDPKDTYYYFNSNVLKMDAVNASLLASYNVGASGKTSLGIGFDKLSGYGYFLNDYRYTLAEGMKVHIVNSEARLKRTRMTLGMVHKFSEASSLGIYYRAGINSSDQENRHTPESGLSLLYIIAGDRSIISTVSSEAGIRFRAPITRRLFYGIEGSYLYERINSRQKVTDQPIDKRRFLGRRARIGGGLGIALTSRILLNADIAGGLFNTSKPAELYYIGYRARPTGEYDSYITPNLSIGERGKFISFHSAVRARIWRNAFATGSYLRTIRKNTSYYNNGNGQSPSNYREVASFFNVGVGWNFKPGFTAEYLISTDHYKLSPSHSLILRYTFNFNIKNEE
jgi:hypothetical protein